ncbi:hybrid sensor histidine kinase/response regulator [Plebeiibacterium sediminum]|uniref:histidine kinase n=1 Tax=Plebeiibacterium sediminum TaxID=2992112 RepID=A0AAE3M804_9BACT|nr:ATP-binding protein [Plebeiobacterium sediminum]MCW3788951.1 ATP-binding protein [Plebeiobacterium sediminum]
MNKIVPEKWIQTKVTLGFIIIIAIAIVIFTIGYFSVASIIKVQNESVTNEEEFTYLNQLIFEIIETEGISRVYGVTGNEEYKEQYELHHDSVLSIISYLPKLFTDKSSVNSIAEVKRSYLKKKELMDQLVQINIINLHRTSAESLLESIPDSLNYQITEYTYTTVKVDSLDEDTSSIEEEEPEDQKRKGFLKRMSDFLSGKKKKDVAQEIAPTISKQVDSTVQKRVRTDQNIKQIKTQLKKASKQDELFNRKLQRHENDLIQLDRILTEQIKSIVNNLQNISVQKNARRRAEMESMRSSFLDRVLLLVSSAISLMLFFIYWISRDITKSQKLNNDIIRAKERVDRLLKVKEQFVAHMSHEIRTPLTAIIGFSEQLSMLKLGGQQKDILERIKLSAQHLIGLINNILDFSSLESGKVEFFKDQIDAKVMMEELHHLFDLKAYEKGIEFSYTVDDQLIAFESDSLRLKQVLINLIGNAFKFTPEGYVKYGVELKKDKLVFTVSDSGIGIPKDKQKSIFKMFNQVNISLSRKYTGTGLGLSISRQIIEAMGGSISVQSKMDEGSTFKFDIPYVQGKQLAKSSKNESVYSFKNKSILAVDDDEMICQVIDGILHHKCQKLDVNSSVDMALKALEHNQYDLLMIDLHMPQIDGLQLMHIIREEKHIDTPILFLTADMVNAELKKANDNKSVWIMAKPFTHNQIMEKLTEIFGNIDNESEPVENETESFPNNKTEEMKSKEANQLYDLDGVKSFTGDDKAFLDSIIQTFIENTDVGIKDTEDAIRKVDHHQTAEKAHKMLTGFRQFKIEHGIHILTQIESTRDVNLKEEVMENLLSELKTLWQPIKTDLQNIMD